MASSDQTSGLFSTQRKNTCSMPNRNSVEKRMIASRSMPFSVILFTVGTTFPRKTLLCANAFTSLESHFKTVFQHRFALIPRKTHGKIILAFSSRSEKLLSIHFTKLVVLHKFRVLDLCNIYNQKKYKLLGINKESFDKHSGRGIIDYHYRNFGEERT